MRRRRELIMLTVIALLTAFTLWAVLTPKIKIGGFERGGAENRGMVLGLDLQGGTHLVYEANLSDVPAGETGDRMSGVLKIIENRVNAFGVTEPVIQQLGNNRILIQLPGIRNTEDAVQLIGQTAVLDFREVYLDAEGNPILSEDGNLQWVPAEAIAPDGERKWLKGEHLKSNTTVIFDPQTNAPEVRFELKGDGPSLFEQVTSRLLGQPLGIFLDDRLISFPTVQAVLSTGGVITNLNLEEARELSILLNEGALPVPLGHWEGEEFRSGPAIRDDVDPTLGADFLRNALIAGALGLGLVLLFMMLYYRLPGVMASLSLVIYALLVLTIFKMIPVTLTLAGIAAFVLSIGMAVDANVLIFERMKEELRTGRTLGAAIETGFNRAWPSIRASNISTFIICGILYQFGRWFVAPTIMGFALTLFIGVAVSMFTAIVITRTFLRLFVGTRLAHRVSFFTHFLDKEALAQKEGP